MNKVIKLQENIEKMLTTSKKNKACALEWTEGLTKILEPGLVELYGKSVIGGHEDTVNIKGHLYFRFIYHHSNNINSMKEEKPGFYLSNDGINVWGTPISKLTTVSFWSQIDRINNWLNTISDKIKEKTQTIERVITEYEKKL